MYHTRNMNMSKIISILLCVMTMLPVSTANAQDFDDGTYRYAVINNTKNVTIKGLVNQQVADINIPATVTNNTSTYQVTEISNSAFAEGNNAHHITSVILPTTIKTVRDNAFKNCILLKTVKFQADEMISIGNSAFYDCITLEAVQMPKRLSKLGSSTFYKCKKLQSLVIPEGVKEVQSTTFNNCASLVTLTLPSTLETIRAYSLGLCTALKTLHIPASVTTIEPGSFRENQSLESITVDENNQNFISVKGVLFKKDMTRLMVFPPKAPYQENFEAYYVVPSTVTHIGHYAFNHCPYTHITLPSGLQDIGNDAFLNAKITELTIPASVKTIRTEAFSRTPVKLYMMSTTPPQIDDTNISGHTVYVKPSALAAYQANAQWQKAKLSTSIPLDLNAGWNTRCFDFDVQCPTDGTVIPYAVTAFDPATRTTTITPFDGGYIPSRQGNNHNEFVGVLIKATSATVNVTMGENDYVSGHQKTYDGPNYLIGTTVPTFVTVKETREGVDYTNFGLSQGEFRKLSKDGISAPTKWNRAYLSLPLTPADSRNAKAFSFFFNDNTTGIGQIIKNENGDPAWYTTAGVRISNPKHGIYIHNGRKVILP